MLRQKSMHTALSNPGTWQMEMLCSEYTAIGSNCKHAEALGSRKSPCYSMGMALTGAYEFHSARL